MLKLHPAHRIDLLIDWHYKSPPRQMADGRYLWYLQKYIPPSEVISSIQTFCNAANQFVPSIATLFCKMKLSFANPKTSKRQLLYQRLRKSTSFVDLCYLIVSQKLILFLSNAKEPCYTQKYSNKKGCGPVDCDFDTLALFP